MIYKINHIWTAEMKWKWRNDRRSERNLCLKKIQDFSGVWAPDLVITGAMLYQLSYEATDVGSRSNFFHGNIWTHNWPAPIVSSFIAQLVEHRTDNREVTGSNPVEVLNFFQASLRNCINCVHCDDHFFIFTSFPLFIYDLFQISLTLFVNHWKYSLNRSRKKIS